MNVSQLSARDVNLTSPQATATLSNSQLVLLDGRSIYLDFSTRWPEIQRHATDVIAAVATIRPGDSLPLAWQQADDVGQSEP